MILEDKGIVSIEEGMFDQVRKEAYEQ